jgi:hypothetical protein
MNVGLYTVMAAQGRYRSAVCIVRPARDMRRVGFNVQKIAP